MRNDKSAVEDTLGVRDGIQHAATHEEEPVSLPVGDHHPHSSSFVDEVLDLQKRFEERREAAIEKLLLQQKDVQEKLERLGYRTSETEAEVSEKAEAGPAVTNSDGGSNGRPSVYGENRHCKICDIRGHDARAHRGQAKKKKFTDAELASL